MTLRFRRSIRLFPGVHVGVNRRGVYSSAGIPGTGLYAVHHYRTAPGAHRVGGGVGGCGPLVVLIVIFIVIAAIGSR
jgi:hypothetical protein